MSWKVLEQDPYLDHRVTFMISSADDIASVPSAFADVPEGSIAYTPDLMNIYQKGNDGNWHKVGG